MALAARPSSPVKAAFRPLDVRRSHWLRAAGAPGAPGSAPLRPLRGQTVQGVASPRLGCALLLRVRPLRTSAAFSPPRPQGRLTPARSHSRPERHFADSFITVRLAIPRLIAACLPRCPACHRPRRRPPISNGPRGRITCLSSSVVLSGQVRIWCASFSRVGPSATQAFAFITAERIRPLIVAGICHIEAIIPTRAGR